ncbi:MAG: peptidase ClpP [Paenibacillaceae bacterium]|jgi:phosphopantothenoylcysteine decarboxylase/phosphopantothenate--cysteine ligase|nr:peptidase ClpP [Paenibacillaceae bacterium]
MLHGKTIVLGVTGGIAAYKAAAVCSQLTQRGAEVHVIMTASACKFIAPLTFQTLSRQPVTLDTFEERDASVVMHINLADKADLVLVAPATANILAKMAHGLADDMLSTTLLATTAPVLVAPAMNVHMLTHPAVVRNIEILRERGVRFVEPGEGQLACGYVGQGRLAEPQQIVDKVESFFLETKTFQGKRVLVTAGGTQERIDPVRYLTNDSSGKMGFAIAEAARDLGAKVTLVTAPSALLAPSGVETVRVVSAEEMMQAVLNRLSETDIVIKAAAVADYRPAHPSAQKIKKKAESLTLELVRNEDILQKVGELKRSDQFVIGFAAETDNVEQYAMDKLRRKNCDLVVANDVTQSGAGFGTDTNLIRVFDANGLVADLPLMSKYEAAMRLLKIAADKMHLAGGAG